MRKQTLRRLARFMRCAGIGLLFAVVAILAPCPVWTPEIFTWWQVPIVVLTLILYLGVVLFDTLFFDRYH